MGRESALRGPRWPLGLLAPDLYAGTYDSWRYSGDERLNWPWSALSAGMDREMACQAPCLHALFSHLSPWQRWGHGRHLNDSVILVSLMTPCWSCGLDFCSPAGSNCHSISTALSGWPLASQNPSLWLDELPARAPSHASHRTDDSMVSVTGCSAFSKSMA